MSPTLARDAATGAGVVVVGLHACVIYGCHKVEAAPNSPQLQIRPGVARESHPHSLCWLLALRIPA